MLLRLQRGQIDIKTLRFQDVKTSAYFSVAFNLLVTRNS
jgi:hypothetical protein